MFVVLCFLMIRRPRGSPRTDTLFPDTTRFRSGFRWAPDFARGLVRDLRVRWALIEAGRDYEIELIGFEERASGTYRQRQPFGMVPAFEADGQRLFESGAKIGRAHV